MKGYLELEDGTIMNGSLFGSEGDSDGEVVFNTGMVGYVESLTDPSYRGQILNLTYPLMGNYGVPDFSSGDHRFESDEIQVRGIVVSSLVGDSNHWEALTDLDGWLRDNGVVGISGIDTRALTKRLRSRGTMLGRIIRGLPESRKFKVEDPNKKDLVSQVSTGAVNVLKSPQGRKGPRITLVDCGAKRSIIRSLLERGCTVTVVPHTHNLEDMEHDGILISNGPGDPALCTSTIDNIKKVMDGDDPVPIAGICLGCQIIALAAGARTYKLPFGHRSQNQPCRETESNECVITSQNHGYAVKGESLPRGWRVWYENLNDGTVEGIKHEKLPFMAVQFHPEAHPGPTDSDGFFDLFLEVADHA